MRAAKPETTMSSMCRSRIEPMDGYEVVASDSSLDDPVEPSGGHVELDCAVDHFSATSCISTFHERESR